MQVPRGRFGPRSGISAKIHNSVEWSRQGRCPTQKRYTGENRTTSIKTMIATIAVLLSGAILAQAAAPGALRGIGTNGAPSGEAVAAMGFPPQHGERRGNDTAPATEVCSTSGSYPYQFPKPCSVVLGHGNSANVYIHIDGGGNGRIGWFVNSTQDSSAPLDYIVYKDGNVYTQGGLHSGYLVQQHDLDVGPVGNGNQWSINVHQADLFGHARAELGFCQGLSCL